MFRMPTWFSALRGFCANSLLAALITALMIMTHDALALMYYTCTCTHFILHVRVPPLLVSQMYMPR